jgi:outer membrane protein assembly factor BamB
MTRVNAAVLGIGLAVGLCAVAGAAEPVPYGHKDFYPTPERPVGFRGDGSGAFPGATPVTQWREGDYDLVEMQVENWGDAGGNARGSFGKAKVPVYRNSNSVNIVWKTEMPSFANSMPIVVGDRVFTTAEPHSLVCVDARTGKILWQRELDPFELLGQSPEEVKSNTTLLEATHAVHAAYYRIVCNYHRIHPSQMKPKYWREWRENFVELRESLGREAPADKRGVLAKTVESIGGVVAELDRLLAGAESQDGALADKDAMDAAIDRLMKALKGVSPGGFGCAGDPRIGWMVKEYGLHPWHHWYGWLGWTFATPVSDGKHVFVTMGQRQAACSDLDGKRIWARMVPQPAPVSGAKATFDGRDGGLTASPVLAGNVVVMRFTNGGLAGLDKATGETKWSVAQTSGGFVGSQGLVRLADGTEVLVTKPGEIIRVRDGKVLLSKDAAPFKGESSALAMVSFGDAVVVNAKKMAAWRLSADGDKVTGEELWQCDAHGGNESPALTDKYLILEPATVVDRATGKIISKGATTFSGPETNPSTLAGSYLIRWRGECYGGHGNQGIRNRPNQDQVFSPAQVWKLNADGRTELVTPHSLLGGLNRPRSPILEKYLPEAYRKNRLWCKENGVVPHFGYAQGLFAQGNRLFLRSCSHLYCIGDPKVPYDWNPASRPGDVTEALKAVKEWKGNVWGVSSSLRRASSCVPPRGDYDSVYVVANTGTHLRCYDLRTTGGNP